RGSGWQGRQRGGLLAAAAGAAYNSPFVACAARRRAGPGSPQGRRHEEVPMSRVCQVTGKGPATGNNVSHANNKTRRRFLPNLHWHRFWLESENRFVRLRLTAKGMRIIDKRGIDAVLAELRARGEKV